MLFNFDGFCLHLVIQAPVFGAKNLAFALWRKGPVLWVRKTKTLWFATQLGSRLTSIFANVYAGQTIIEDPAPLAARGWGMTDQNLTCQNLKDAKRKMLRSVGAAQHDKL